MTGGSPWNGCQLLKNFGPKNHQRHIVNGWQGAISAKRIRVPWANHTLTGPAIKIDTQPTNLLSACLRWFPQHTCDYDHNYLTSEVQFVESKWYGQHHKSKTSGEALKSIQMSSNDQSPYHGYAPTAVDFGRTSPGYHFENPWNSFKYWWFRS